MVQRSGGEREKTIPAVAYWLLLQPLMGRSALHVQRQILYTADHYRLSGVNRLRRYCVPEFSLNKDLSRRDKRRARYGNLSNQSLNAGHNLVTTGADGDAHEKDGNQADGNSYRQ